MGKTVAFHNLGCKVNSYETEKMLRNFADLGYEVVEFDQKADVYVVNTCTVTQIADKKSRQMLARARRLNPDAVVVAVGCAVETGGMAGAGPAGRAPHAAEQGDHPGRNGEEGTDRGPADIILGNLQKNRAAEIVDAYLAEGRRAETLYMPRTDAGYTEFSCSGKNTVSSRARAFLKIQDGCDQFCTYCVIPYARGRTRSRDAAAVLEEAGSIADAGIKEIVLTGIHLCSYGADRSGKADTEGGNPFGMALLELIKRLEEIPGLERIRLGSLEPRMIDGETAKEIAALVRGGKLCPHFHISLQSGCDETLRRMNRHYTTEQYMRSVELLRELIDRPAITTDVIAGFPGETEKEFEATRAFLERAELYEIHVFPYSKREGTAAASMPGQLTRAEKERRAGILLALTAAQSKKYRENFIGRELEILSEETVTIDGTQWLTGHTERYVRACIRPEGEQAVLPGRMIRGKAVGFAADDMLKLLQKSPQ